MGTVSFFSQIFYCILRKSISVHTFWEKKIRSLKAQGHYAILGALCYKIQFNYFPDAHLSLLISYYASFRRYCCLLSGVTSSGIR